jgi:hypothetical protein
MARFLIEVPHEANFVACERAVRVFLDTGSHFLSHADWGCMDGVHKAWLIVDVETKEQAYDILPAAYRNQALIVKLNEFTLPQMDEMAKQHAGKLQ